MEYSTSQLPRMPQFVYCQLANPGKSLWSLLGASTRCELASTLPHVLKQMCQEACSDNAALKNACRDTHGVVGRGGWRNAKSRTGVAVGAPGSRLF